MRSHTSETVCLRLKMRALIIFLFLTTGFFQISQCVQVTDSGYSFSLEAVKTLKKLMDFDTSTNLRQTYGDAASLCADPDLPGEFRVLCEKDDADEVFQHLAASMSNLIFLPVSPARITFPQRWQADSCVKITSPIDPCEICANVACTGCS